jgi:hypothetical protein
MSEDVKVIEQEVAKELRGLIEHLSMEVSLLREQVRTQVSSRRGLEGARGEKGEKGDPGLPAVIKIVQADGKVQVLDGDKVAAEIITVPGKDGKDGVSVTGAPGRNGVDGKSAPSLGEIVAATLSALKSRL